MTDDTITQLGRLSPQRLSVIARTSSMRYKKRDIPLDQIGRELGVDYVLEGSARREGNRVRINTTLIEVRNQTQRWADSFERELAGTLAVQSDVARGVAGSLAITLLPAEQARFASARQVNGDAYEAYLKGLGYFYKLTPQDLDTALKYFDLALQRDPNDAQAYAAIAAVWLGRSQLGFASAADAAPRARAAATKAIELNDSIAEAHSALGMLAWSEWDWPRAESEFRRAIDLNPSYAEARLYYSNLLAVRKQPDETLAQARRALALDPFNAFFEALYGLDLLCLRRFDEALGEYKQALRTPPPHPVALFGITSVYYNKRMYAEGLEAARAYAAGIGYDEAESLLARRDSSVDYPQAMAQAADALAARSRSTFVSPFDVGTWYAYAGDKQHALDWLEKGYRARDPSMPYIALPEFDTLRGEPRFQELLRRMKLPS